MHAIAQLCSELDTLSITYCTVSFMPVKKEKSTVKEEVPIESLSETETSGFCSRSKTTSFNIKLKKP